MSEPSDWVCPAGADLGDHVDWPSCPSFNGQPCDAIDHIHDFDRVLLGGGLACVICDAIDPDNPSPTTKDPE